MTNANRIRQVLSIGDYVYIAPTTKVIPSQVQQIDKDGIETEYDYYTYDELGMLWWLTKICAEEAQNENQ